MGTLAWALNPSFGERCNRIVVAQTLLSVRLLPRILLGAVFHGRAQVRDLYKAMESLAKF